MSATKPRKHKVKPANYKKTQTAPAGTKSPVKKKRPTKLFDIPLNNWKTKAVIFFLLVVSTALLYNGAVHTGFFSVDDEYYVIKDPWIRNIDFQTLKHVFTTLNYSNYSPLHLVSYMFDYTIAGVDPVVFHISNNIWAGICAGFVYLTALAITRHPLVSIAAAFLFVVNPSHVEAVAWISSRKDLVATAFALPSVIAYLQYRKQGKNAMRWYIASVVLYLCGILGKSAVGILPAVFLGFDLFVEKRKFKNSILDKIPYGVLTVLVVLVVYVAQPASGIRFDASVFTKVMLHSIWLLTGFGEYVVFRLRPEDGSTVLKAASIVFLLALFIAPLLLRKKFPKTMVLIYWVLLGLLPAQVMSFIHPVSDRYLFFPSVGFVIILSWAIVKLAERYGRKAVMASVALLLLFALLWTKATLDYLSEWKDPRSIWFSAVEKSADPHNPYLLGGYYLEVAGKLGAQPRGEKLTADEAHDVAAAIWKDNPKLNDLYTEWQAGKNGGPAEKEFQTYLWTLAWPQFEKALQTKGMHVMPELMFKRGTLLLDKGDLQSAKKEFLHGVQETGLSTVDDVKSEVLVSCHNALGAVAWRQGNYREALNWYDSVYKEQTQAGADWIPDIADKRKKMQAMVDVMTGKVTADNKNFDPEVAYNLGMHYLDVANQLGTNPSVKPFVRETCEALAKEVWSANNNQLAALTGEWDKQQHGGAAELAFQQELRLRAWQQLQEAVRGKGDRPMPQLFFRRGMIYGEAGDAANAKKEFLTAIDEAAKDSSLSIKQQYTVSSHDALGILAWRAGDYATAYDWFQKAEEEQKSFGTVWVADISSKKQQMANMLKKK